jgi:hypothetical protein
MDESTPIDVVLYETRRRIAEARQPQDELRPSLIVRRLQELADAAELLAGYVGQPDMEKVALYRALSPAAAAEREHQVLHMGYAPRGPKADLLLEDDEEDPVAGEFCMSDVVDRIREIAPDVVAYVEQTGGGCATIYAGLRRPVVPAEPEYLSDEAVLYQAPGELDEDWGRWPVMAGPGSFDWHGRDHTAHLDDFYVGPDTELMAPVPGPPYGPYPGEYTATREDTPATLAERIVAAVRAFRPEAEGVAEGVRVWAGRNAG